MFEQSLEEDLSLANAERLVVFTDMDGTLLDHHTYSFAAALPALQRLKSAAIPVIPVTSKTRAELIPLMQQLGLDGPFIVENGAGIFMPKNSFDYQPEGTESVDKYWCFSQVSPRSRWLTVLNELKKEFAGEFTHFSEMGIDGVQAATGLSRARAALACERDYGEPVQWTGAADRREQFIQACIACDANVLQGGRFLHVAGASDKGEAVQWLVREFRSANYPKFETVGLGDSPNDLALLNAVDYAVIVRGVNSETLDVIKPSDRLQRTEQWGPAGWQHAISVLLDKKNISVLGCQSEGADI